MFRQIFLVSSTIFLAVNSDYAYTTVSKTIGGKYCVNNCIDNKCIVDWKDNIGKCLKGKESAPKYFTAQTQDKTSCLSRCGKFGYSYEWCFVSEKGDWDYCSSEVKIKWTKNQKQTLYYGPCADHCKMDGSTYKCTNYGGYRTECDIKKSYTYLIAKTIYGDDCVTECKKHNGRSSRYYWCEDRKQKKEYCAPPAQAPTFDDFFKDLIASNCSTKFQRTKRCISDVNADQSKVLQIANKLEESNYFKTLEVNESRNPVYSYTVRLPRNSEEPILPLVIRAKITAQTTRPVETRKGKLLNHYESNLKHIATLPEDVPSDIIGYQLGGPAKMFNIIPQRPSVIKAFEKINKLIISFVKSEDNEVNVTVVVMYANSTRPHAFGVNIILKSDKGVVKIRKDKMLYNLETGEEKLLQEPLRITTTESVKSLVYDTDIGLW